MISCLITNLKTNQIYELSSNKIELVDHIEYQLTLVLDKDIKGIPQIKIGDINVSLIEVSSSQGNYKYQSLKGDFFDNALFLNYFGECEVIIQCGSYVKSFLLDVNVTSYKASTAAEMLNYLTNNAKHVLQTCYSKSQSSFSFNNGEDRDVVKMSALKNGINYIESVLPSFQRNNKVSIQHHTEENSDKHQIVDDTCAMWLFDNLDSLQLTSDTAIDNIQIGMHNYQVNIPNSKILLNTDTKENRCLHQFISNALKYINEKHSKTKSKIKYLPPEVEYSEYVKFDDVIKGVINPILINELESIEKLKYRITTLKKFFTSFLPVTKVNGEMPIQTSYTLRHKHYANTFNYISIFYKASDCDKSDFDFLLKLRNLTTLFELSCLYYLVNYFHKFSEAKSISKVNDSLNWIGEKNQKVNVLGNEFIFENEFYKYQLAYEKSFYPIDVKAMEQQNGNLVRIDSNHHCKPDFTIKVINKQSNEFYFVILDAKLQRRYKMVNTNVNKMPSVLQCNFTKYGTNLKALRNGKLENLTRYVGVIFGLSQNEGDRERVLMFNKEHDIDGIAPMYPFSAADFISFASVESGNIDNMLNKYIET